MKKNYPTLHYHTWKDLGGPIGLVLDSVFLVGVLIAASFMILLGVALVALEYLATPFVSLFRHKF
jgi:hypothetical protein